MSQPFLSRLVSMAMLKRVLLATCIWFFWPASQPSFVAPCANSEWSQAFNAFRKPVFFLTAPWEVFDEDDFRPLLRQIAPRWRSALQGLEPRRQRQLHQDAAQLLEAANKAAPPAAWQLQAEIVQRRLACKTLLLEMAADEVCFFPAHKRPASREQAQLAGTVASAADQAHHALLLVHLLLADHAMHVTGGQAALPVLQAAEAATDAGAAALGWDWEPFNQVSEAAQRRLGRQWWQSAAGQERCSEEWNTLRLMYGRNGSVYGSERSGPTAAELLETEQIGDWVLTLQRAEPYGGSSAAADVALMGGQLAILEDEATLVWALPPSAFTDGIMAKWRSPPFVLANTTWRLLAGAMGTVGCLDVGLRPERPVAKDTEIRVEGSGAAMCLRLGPSFGELALWHAQVEDADPTPILFWASEDLKLEQFLPSCWALDTSKRQEVVVVVQLHEQNCREEIVDTPGARRSPLPPPPAGGGTAALAVENRYWHLLSQQEQQAWRVPPATPAFNSSLLHSPALSQLASAVLRLHAGSDLEQRPATTTFRLPSASNPSAVASFSSADEYTDSWAGKPTSHTEGKLQFEGVFNVTGLRRQRMARSAAKCSPSTEPWRRSGPQAPGSRPLLEATLGELLEFSVQAALVLLGRWTSVAGLAMFLCYQLLLAVCLFLARVEHAKERRQRSSGGPPISGQPDACSSAAEHQCPGNDPPEELHLFAWAASLPKRVHQRALTLARAGAALDSTAAAATLLIVCASWDLQAWLALYLLYYYAWRPVSLGVADLSIAHARLGMFSALSAIDGLVARKLLHFGFGLGKGFLWAIPRLLLTQALRTLLLVHVAYSVTDKMGLYVYHFCNGASFIVQLAGRSDTRLYVMIPAHQWKADHRHAFKWWSLQAVAAGFVVRPLLRHLWCNLLSAAAQDGNAVASPPSCSTEGLHPVHTLLLVLAAALAWATWMRDLLRATRSMVHWQQVEDQYGKACQDADTLWPLARLESLLSPSKRDTASVADQAEQPAAHHEQRSSFQRLADFYCFWPGLLLKCLVMDPFAAPCAFVCAMLTTGLFDWMFGPSDFVAGLIHVWNEAPHVDRAAVKALRHLLGILALPLTYLNPSFWLGPAAADCLQSTQPADGEPATVPPPREEQPPPEVVAAQQRWLSEPGPSPGPIKAAAVVLWAVIRGRSGIALYIATLFSWRGLQVVGALRLQKVALFTTDIIEVALFVVVLASTVAAAVSAGVSKRRRSAGAARRAAQRRRTARQSAATGKSEDDDDSQPSSSWLASLRAVPFLRRRASSNKIDAPAAAGQQRAAAAAVHGTGQPQPSWLGRMGSLLTPRPASSNASAAVSQQEPAASLSPASPLQHEAGQQKQKGRRKKQRGAQKQPRQPRPQQADQQQSSPRQERQRLSQQQEAVAARKQEAALPEGGPAAAATATSAGEAPTSAVAGCSRETSGFTKQAPKQQRAPPQEISPNVEPVGLAEQQIAASQLPLPSAAEPLAAAAKAASGAPASSEEGWQQPRPSSRSRGAPSVAAAADAGTRRQQTVNAGAAQPPAGLQAAGPVIQAAGAAPPLPAAQQAVGPSLQAAGADQRAPPPLPLQSVPRPLNPVAPTAAPAHIPEPPEWVAEMAGTSAAQASAAGAPAAQLGIAEEELPEWVAEMAGTSAAQASAAGAQPGLLDDQDDDEDLCVMCWEAPRQTTLAPCGHRALCLACTRLVRSRAGSCPICRMEVESFILREYVA